MNAFVGQEALTEEGNSQPRPEERGGQPLQTLDSGNSMCLVGVLWPLAGCPQVPLLPSLFLSIVFVILGATGQV